MEYFRHDKGVAFSWQDGRQYIEVYWVDALALTGPEAVPFTVINVVDQAGEQSVTAETWTAACDEWLTASEGDLGGYLEHSI